MNHAMHADRSEHICVCICTFKRQALLKRLLHELGSQHTEGLFTYSVVVADNDPTESARPVVLEFARNSSVETVYCVQPQQSIALTRNKALANAKGDFVAFIDDDEFPICDWLLILFKTCKEYGVDGVLGPVRPYFDQQAPGWVIKGGFYDRPTYKTGFVIDWGKGRTGNTFLRRAIFEGLKEPFNPVFLTGEDQDFFRRMIRKGHIFIWCNEAVAYEVVPPLRWKRSFMLRRALLRGQVCAVHPTSGAVHLAKSLVAVPLYAAALPFLLLAGHHLFMKYLVKLCDHAGRLLGFLNLNPVKDTYVTE
jgi:succinoglycan biosynthesis protein ExoM